MHRPQTQTPDPRPASPPACGHLLSRRTGTILAGLLAALLIRPARCAAAQAPLPDHSADGLLGVAKVVRDRHRVVISLENHRLYLMEGPTVVWSAPIGTGTGARLSGEGRSWEFSTPRGLFQVQLKEKDPVWFLPDWVFVERGEPVPPPGSPERQVKGMLGDAALYLTPEIAIHGTDHPEQLGGDVSHGCIRISNEDVRRLYEEVRVGTPVLIR